MKKVFTLALGLVTLSSVFAQSRFSGKEDIDYIKYNTAPSYSSLVARSNSNAFSDNEKNKEIRQINKYYDKQILSVKRSRVLRNFEKERQVRMLEIQRDQKIKDVNERFSDHHNFQHDRQLNRKW